MVKMHTLETKVPPPVVVLAIGALMWLASRLAPALAFPLPLRPVLALALAGVGIACAVAGVLAFHAAKTTVNPLRPQDASRVVKTGPYRFSRNPMYLGMLLLLAGWALFLANVLALCCLPLFIIYMNRFQIVPEERALCKHFGSEYANYMKEVRRWL